eukprot:CAMPEP_0178925186 /NCGR_PEP_ID=MMETSP0786-20121207/17763_1 /TAXON_ID=186022 /ORGANISM="Thalassionema frauenfeldii, Strain CCMP 1798" /LENGTH=91 /DNA_ID=CAMNT_0020600021 /DNA_START=14 /DNA_END=286 /DNA_ORIENTATION=+
MTQTKIHAKQTGKPNPPPGAPEGGQWGCVKYGGDKTALLCVILCLLTGVFSGCGLCAYACPQDEKDAYRVKDQIYDVHGRKIGRAGDVEFY